MGMGRLFSMKNIALIAGAAFLGPKLLPSVDSKLVAAGAGFVGAGPLGAVVGYLAAPFLSGMAGSSSVSGSAAVRY